MLGEVGRDRDPHVFAYLSGDVGYSVVSVQDAAHFDLPTVFRRECGANAD
ncbi:hypothetical protein J7E97_28995 [Streptomyces sp. ISL-66]|nr:hypothetical protein [Streptomyces sp. ISL-66]MBT2471795.1 hypothetical protein [Streptomyces sp. ISL-66]